MKVRAAILKKPFLIISFLLIISMAIIGCGTNKTLTFVGNTKHWAVKMVVTDVGDNEQKEVVTYKYRGKRSDLKKVHHIELSYDAVGSTANQKENAFNGLSKKIYTLTGSGSGAKITKYTEPKATIILGENGIKETTDLNLEKK